ncbi:MAG TPA: YciI family protein [Acidimicrobiales bacterium]|nr:YciI family protein [Acidimicrobiales bacterium]
MGVTPEFIQAELARAKTYAVVYLLAGPRYDDHPDGDALVMAHVTRNFELKADGVLAIVGPTRSDGDVRGLYIFNCDPAQAARLIEDDPAVAAGMFRFEVQSLMAFPGDTLT